MAIVDPFRGWDHVISLVPAWEQLGRPFPVILGRLLAQETHEPPLSRGSKQPLPPTPRGGGGKNRQHGGQGKGTRGQEGQGDEGTGRVERVG